MYPCIIKESVKFNQAGPEGNFSEIKKKKKRWWNKTSGKIFLILVFVLVVFSYFRPELGEEYSVKLIIMLIRSFLVLFLWFTLVSPLLFKAFRRIIGKKQISYLAETNKILSAFTELKRISSHSWKESLKFKGYARLKFFVTSILLLALFSNTEF